MKDGLFISFIFLLLLAACSKKKHADMDVIQEVKPYYDTTAIDSFSAGATSVDVAEQIRVSSRKYQDSVKAALKAEQEEKRLKEELEKENKKKEEENKKKTEEEKKQKEAQSSTPDNTKTE